MKVQLRNYKVTGPMTGMAKGPIQSDGNQVSVTFRVTSPDLARKASKYVVVVPGQYWVRETQIKEYGIFLTGAWVGQASEPGNHHQAIDEDSVEFEW